MRPTRYQHDLSLHYAQHHKTALSEAEYRALNLIASAWASSEDWPTTADLETLRQVDARLRPACPHRA